MWSEKKLYLNGAVAILAFSVASMSAASAKHLRPAGKSSYTVSAPKSRLARQSGHVQRASNQRYRFVGPALNLNNNSAGYYPPYGYPFSSRSYGSRRATIGYYNNPYVQYSTSPFTGYYGWYGQLSP
jgi:hypothetical protein